jgi:hypothetical protein
MIYVGKSKTLNTLLNSGFTFFDAIEFCNVIKNNTPKELINIKFKKIYSLRKRVKIIVCRGCN